MKRYLILPLALAAASINANEYQTFAQLNYSKLNNNVSDYEAYNLSLAHFFSPKQSLGPLNEFEYINKTSNAFASYTQIESDEGYAVGGTYFADSFLVGASISDYESFQTKNLSVGYLVNDDLLFKIEASDPDSGDTTYTYSAQYNYQLEGNDYLGFRLSAFDDLDNVALSSTYFTKLENGGIFKADVNLYHSEYDDNWNTKLSYFFNERTSTFVGVSDDDSYNIGATHFFNDNYALTAAYFDSGDDADGFNVSFSAQF